MEAPPSRQYLSLCSVQVNSVQPENPSALQTGGIKSRKQGLWTAKVLDRKARPQEFVKDAGSYSKRMVDDLLDQVMGGDHSRVLSQLRQRRNIPMKPPDEVKVGDALGDSSSSALDFMAVKSYSDISLDISTLSSLGRGRKELEHDDGHLDLDETTKLLQDLHEAQAERGSSRPSSNLSSLSNTSERDQHHLSSPSRLSVGEQQDAAHDPYEFLQSPEPAASVGS